MGSGEIELIRELKISARRPPHSHPIERDSDIRDDKPLWGDLMAVHMVGDYTAAPATDINLIKKAKAQ